ncbi:hypothetical protein [Sphingomonas sp. ERG5]|uniref:hypothetical protein n=1 Tax=Sphingomonas sp. ERG5 TaxID=1381597 RepID=UPI001269D50D|nr:hypothetical protein [Sphingomonas sp. ERG5]
MTLELRSVSNRGDLSKERLTFRVTTSVDVGDYVVLQVDDVNGDVSTDVHHAFWFTYKAVTKGDLIVLYTRRGNQSSKPLKEKGTAHFYYWGLGAPIWGDDHRAAVLLEAPRWTSKSARELSGR